MIKEGMWRMAQQLHTETVTERKRQTQERSKQRTRERRDQECQEQRGQDAAKERKRKWQRGEDTQQNEPGAKKARKQLA